ncbi:hypothetical protein K505DRAFT_302331 [Melanomma pulvis-pyrius CBS 109.77]|uniref:Spindle pole body-associated protein cut12 domain-containing protein n=1 Tax=Melanomma pulvis-pyrius CBS 109.77 TaxID=1314802 RepID=A0A6A6XFF2_9PLEO|nr:hypothetical protein K505DRAFT_302331 [Melanomma pulvis-pyrius CBS 109.77]
MFTWITGPRITNVIEDLEPDPACDTTFIEPPETPAHQFAVKAFKHALFGTPGAEEATNPAKKAEKKAKLDLANSKALGLPAPKETTAPSSPSKQPGGILMTPGTANKGRKTVSFGSQVVDNEAKRADVGKTGIPNDCPGKFPSPWTPGTELKVDAGKDKKPHNKLTAALLDARTTPQSRSAQKPKSRDDSDITMDVTAPRSESGKYWKEQYESYADKSEREMKKLIAKQQLAKNFAKKKDGEMTEMATRLAEERKRSRQRERDLEQQNKEYQERLRQAMADNTAASVEITALKNRISVLEKSFVAPSSEVQASKISFQIFEDASTSLHGNQNKASESRTRGTMDPPSIILGRPVQSAHTRPGDKENSPPKTRHMRRQTLPDASPRPTTLHSVVPETVQEPAEVSVMPSTSPIAVTRPSQPFAKSTLTARTPELPSKSPMSLRKPDLTKENLPPKSPAALLSSPLPQPSPDPWIVANDSPLPRIDRLAFPISSGASYSRPVKSSQVKSVQHRVSKSVTYIKPDASMAPSSHAERPVHRETKLSIRRPDQYDRDRDPEVKDVLQLAKVDAPPEVANSFVPESVSKGPRVDVAKTASDRAIAPMSATKDRIPSSVDRKERLPVDRKEQARRRLAERKQKKVGA